MIDRRHEKLALDALEDLVRYLRTVREERKAILAITNGWLLFRPNPASHATAHVPGRAHRAANQRSIREPDA